MKMTAAWKNACKRRRRWATTGWTGALFALGISCGQPPSPQPAATAPGPSGTVAPPSSLPPTSAPPRAPAPTPNVELVVPVTDTDPYPMCQADVRPLPLRGAAILHTDTPSAGNNLVAVARRDLQTESGEVALIDALSARKLASLGGVFDGSARLKRAVVTRPGSDSQELLDLKDGSVVRPRIETPEGVAQKYRIALDERQNQVWLVARTQRNTVYYGTWPEPRASPLQLDRALPFWPDLISNGNGILVGDEEQKCLLEPEHPARCFPFAGLADVLGDRHVVSARLPYATVYDAHAQRELLLGGECEWRMGATLQQPPRALLFCKVEDELRWAIWSPEGMTAGWSSEIELRPSKSMRNTRVVPLELLVDSNALVSLWFDLVRQRVIETPPLVPLTPQRRFGSRILAQTDASPSTLFVLDIEAKTLTPIVPALDCDEYLIWHGTSPHHALVACPKETMAEHVFRPLSRPMHYRWLELIDFQTRRRLRTDQVFEGKLTETGIAVGIQPGQVATLAALEWPATCDEPNSMR